MLPKEMGWCCLAECTDGECGYYNSNEHVQMVKLWTTTICKGEAQLYTESIVLRWICSAYVFFCTASHRVLKIYPCLRTTSHIIHTNWRVPRRDDGWTDGQDDVQFAEHSVQAACCRMYINCEQFLIVHAPRIPDDWSSEKRVVSQRPGPSRSSLSLCECVCLSWCECVSLKKTLRGAMFRRLSCGVCVLAALQSSFSTRRDTTCACATLNLCVCGVCMAPGWFEGGIVAFIWMLASACVYSVVHE